jgi:hypothetical protein
MNFSVKAPGFSSQTNLNSSPENIISQPAKEFEFCKIKNEQGDSFLKNKKTVEQSQEPPLLFGQKFINAAIKVAENIKGNKNNVSASVIGEKLAEEIYGVKVNRS